jgi:hypothetical protein
MGVELYNRVQSGYLGTGVTKITENILTRR